VAVFSGGGTGGHLYPALALAEALTGLRPDLQTFFVGSRRGVEAEILPERGFSHLLLPIRGFRRGHALENLSVLWALARSLILTGELFSRLRPGVVVVTGGYAGGPAGLMAVAMGIPLALQEQNAQPGLTTRILSRWSRQIHLAFPEARARLPRRARSKAFLSGNPVRAKKDVDLQEASRLFQVEPGSRVVLIVGGSQGSRALNHAVLDALQEVKDGDLPRPREVTILWATGPGHLEEVEDRLRSFGSLDWVRAVGYIHDMPAALGLATLAVSRAGAMATSEFLAWGVPAVLVPLPTAAADHQSRNAESLAASGAALHLPEKGLDGPALWTAVLGLLADPQRLDHMREAAIRAGRPDATREIARALVGLLPPPTRGPATPSASAAGGPVS